MTVDSSTQYVNILKEWIPKEASVAIAVNDIYIYYAPGIHDIKISVGQPVQLGTIAKEVNVKKCKVEKRIEDSLFGIPYYGIGYPVMINEQEGVVVVILPLTYHSVQKQPIAFLTGKNEDAWCPVTVDKISYIESLQKKTWFYKGDEAYQSIYTLKDLSNRLPDYFLRIHRSYIVNIQHILEISRDISSNIIITLKNDIILPVSQSYTTQVRKTLGF